MSEAVKKKLVFIVNPNSGTGKSDLITSAISKTLDASRFEFEVKKTTARGDAREFALACIKDQVDAVIAVGGDGTVNEVGAALIDSIVPLGIIPTGSGNGLARHLQIPMSINGSLKIVNRFRVQSMDTGIIDGHAFLNVAGIGFDARISHAFADRERRGFKGYVKVILKNILSAKSLNLQLEIKDQLIEEQIFMLSIANGSQFGNNARIAPKACIDDGQLDIAILSKLGFFSAVSFLCHLMLGSLKSNTYFRLLQTTHMDVRGTGGMAHVDGEPVKIADSVRIEMKPLSIKVIS